MRVVFRADASIQIGTGHVMRCLTLAEALRNRGMQTLFICRDLPGFSAQMILDRGHELRVLSAPDETMQVTDSQPAHAAWLKVSHEQDARETEQILRSLEPVDWLIADHYALDVRWEKRLRPYVHRIMVVDDLADRKHDCDLLLDQTLAASTEEYKNLVPTKTRLLLGPRYAMLRPQFAEYRDMALEKRKQTTSIQKILVAMGGTDPSNVTETVLQGLDMIEGKDLKVTVVLGSSAPFLETVKKQASRMSLPITVLSDITNMAEVMVDHDLCIGSGGMTSWERCVVGLPTIMFAFAHNQMKIAEYLAQKGTAFFVSDLGTNKNSKNILLYIIQLKNNMERYSLMSSNSFEICDGLGLFRTIKVICDHE